jgi:hypothetical protein
MIFEVLKLSLCSSSRELMTLLQPVCRTIISCNSSCYNTHPLYRNAEPVEAAIALPSCKMLFKLSCSDQYELQDAHSDGHMNGLLLNKVTYV